VQRRVRHSCARALLSPSLCLSISVRPLPVQPTRGSGGGGKGHGPTRDQLHVTEPTDPRLSGPAVRVWLPGGRGPSAVSRPLGRGLFERMLRMLGPAPGRGAAYAATRRHFCAGRRGWGRDSASTASTGSTAWTVLTDRRLGCGRDTSSGALPTERPAHAPCSNVGYCQTGRSALLTSLSLCTSIKT
jgi:hypothetical protein